MKIGINLWVFSDQLLVGLTGRADRVVGGGQQWDGRTARLGGVESIVAGGQKWGCLQPLFSSSNHKYNSPKTV